MKKRISGEKVEGGQKSEWFLRKEKKWNEVWIYITKVEILVEGVRTSKKDLVWYAPGKLLLIRVVESFSSFFFGIVRTEERTQTQRILAKCWWRDMLSFVSLVTLDIVFGIVWFFFKLELIADLVGLKMSTTFKRKEKHCSDDRSVSHTHFSLVGYFSA